jgi:hypothetical protein
MIKLDAGQQLLHDIYQQLIEINTTDSLGDCTAAGQCDGRSVTSGGLS